MIKKNRFALPIEKKEDSGGGSSEPNHAKETTSKNKHMSKQVSMHVYINQSILIYISTKQCIVSKCCEIKKIK